MRKVIPGLKFQVILDITYFLLLPFAVCFYILKGKFHSGWIERIGGGNWNKILRQKGKFIWIHAVSLGEARLGHLVYENLKKEFPSYRFLLTTITTTGYKYFKSHINKDDFLAYLPLDFSFVVKKMFQNLDIKLLLILETELWPNLIIASAKYNCISGLINARISRKAFRRYRRVSFLFSRIINCLDFITASGENNLERFLTLGRERQNCFWFGSLKFDLEPPGVKEEERVRWLGEYLRKKNLKLLVAGSTHFPEEVFVVKLYLKMKEKYPDWALLLAPRHPEDINKLKAFLNTLGINLSLFSSGFEIRGDIPVFILDEVGYLASFYSLGDLIFVGGSLVLRGGHNIIEPAIFKKPIFIGPYYDNFEDIVEEFKKEEAIVILERERNLLSQLERLIEDSNMRTRLGEKAYRVVARNRGNVDKIIEIITRYLK
jgi:3-deoxy-D-manno-octulosonic-acid transferase